MEMSPLTCQVLHGLVNPSPPATSTPPATPAPTSKSVTTEASPLPWAGGSHVIPPVFAVCTFKDKYQ